MRKHTGKIETSYPFPCMLMLSQSALSRRSKRKDPASVFRQTRRADHDLTHALTVFVNIARESRLPCPSKPEKRLAVRSRSRSVIIPTFANAVTAPRRDLRG